MILPRRQFLQLAAGAAVLPAVSTRASAQSWPARPVRLIIGYTPGGSADLTARLMGQWLSERLGQPFVIENRPGGGTNIATEAVVRAPPDGYHLPACRARQRHQRHALRQAQFQFSARRRAGRGHHPVSERGRGESVGPGEIDPRTDRLRKSQSRQAQYGVFRQRLDHPYVRRTVQDADRHQHGPRALPRRRAGADRYALRPGPGDVRQHPDLRRARQIRQTARPRGHLDDALGSVARPAHGGRFPARLRGERVVRHRRAEGHARRGRSSG